MTQHYRPTFCEINLTALKANYHALKAYVSPHELIPVIKANAYGHGAVSIARLLEAEQVSFLAVSTFEEGVELRSAGLQTPILCLNAGLNLSLRDFFDTQLTPVISDLDCLQKWALQSKSLPKPIKLHLEIDTGMSRWGVLPSEVSEALSFFQASPHLKLEGVFSHFSCSDELEKSATDQQVEYFLTLEQRLKKVGFTSTLLHLPNSAGLLRQSFGGAQLARPGIALYGAYPHPQFKERINLQPVLSWKTAVASLRRLSAHTPISYGESFVTQRESVIATLPVGYADGYSRLLSNRGQVLIGGQRCPVVGRVCMDLIMVDVTDLEEVKIGQEVVLLGIQGQQEITAEELAENIGTISYEIFCNISNRVPRIYS